MCQQSLQCQCILCKYTGYLSGMLLAHPQRFTVSWIFPYCTWDLLRWFWSLMAIWEPHVRCTKVIKLFRIYTVPDVMVGGAFMPGRNSVGLKSTASTPVLIEKTRYSLNNLFTWQHQIIVMLFWIIFLKSILFTGMFIDELLVLKYLQTMGILLLISVAGLKC